MMEWGRGLLPALALFGGLLGGLSAVTSAAAAPPDIVIGAIFPLSGNAAAIGHDAQMALETEADIINGHDDVPMLLGQGGGLPELGGAKIKLVFADSQNNPQIARSEAERLITQDHVVAIIGSYTSATAVTISQLCNRYEIPYISADNSAPSLRSAGAPVVFSYVAHRHRFLESDVRLLCEYWSADGAAGAQCRDHP